MSDFIYLVRRGAGGGVNLKYAQVFKEFDLNIENYSNIDNSFEKVKYSIKTQLSIIATEKYRNKFQENFHHTLTNQNYFLHT